MNPIRARTLNASRSAEIPIFLQKHDKFHTLPLYRQQTLSVIYQAVYQKNGELAAEKWLETQLARTSPPTFPPLTTANLLDSSTPQESNPTLHTEPPAFPRFLKSPEAFKPLLSRYQPPEPGEDALKAAERLISDSWRTSLGLAYPLVLLMVKSALESAIDPSSDQQNQYHCCTTLPSLAILLAAITKRDKAYNQRTIERLLSPTAPHAKALRAWLGWKPWYTRTYIDYTKGTPLSTIGGTVFRVYLSPLTTPDPQIHPLSSAMRNDWRDLEADRHSGRTHGKRYQNADPNRLIPSNVGIYQCSAKELSKQQIIFWEDLSNTNGPKAQTFLGEEYYVYPDIKTLSGAKQLREDVNTYANWLGNLVTGQKDLESVIDRYREAVWISVKAELYGGTRKGWELLDRLRKLALELRKERHTLKNPAGYCWSQIESAGFRELRRDFSYVDGRFYRVMSTRAARELGILA